MTVHLQAFSLSVDPHAHVVLICDGAGWQVAEDPIGPDTVTPLPWPPRAPKFNPVEKCPTRTSRDSGREDRIIIAHDDILDHGCDAWNRLNGAPWNIKSLGLRDWTHRYGLMPTGIKHPGFEGGSAIRTANAACQRMCSDGNTDDPPALIRTSCHTLRKGLPHASVIEVSVERSP